MDYTKVYEDWDKLPDCKIHIPGESMWGKKLPDGTYGINNDPLTPGYRWQDIVNTTNLPEEPGPENIIHRRWNKQLQFRWNEPEEKDKSLLLRKRIVEALKPIGYPGFFWTGLAYVLIEDKDLPEKEAIRMVKEALVEAGIPLNPE